MGINLTDRQYFIILKSLAQRQVILNIMDKDKEKDDLESILNTLITHLEANGKKYIVESVFAVREVVGG